MSLASTQTRLALFSATKQMSKLQMNCKFASSVEQQLLVQSVSSMNQYSRVAARQRREKEENIGQAAKIGIGHCPKSSPLSGLCTQKSAKKGKRKTRLHAHCLLSVARATDPANSSNI